MIIYDLSSKPYCHQIDIINRRPIGFSMQMYQAITEKLSSWNGRYGSMLIVRNRLP